MGKHQLEAILEELQNYAVDHFGYEEKLMEQYKYPGYLNHRKVSIYGGSNEIQRGIISSGILGL